MRRCLCILVACLVGVVVQGAELDSEPEIEFKVLLIVKRDTDAYSPLFLPIRSRMTDAELANVKRCFEVETPDMVKEITGGRVRFTPTLHVSKVPLRRWNPDRLDSAEYDAQEMLAEYYSLAKPGDYDAVGYYFLHRDRASGYQAPRAGYGVGGYNAEHRIGVFAVHCAPDLNPRDEIFLHEWMHGLDGFYGGRAGVKLPKGYLHGNSNYPGYKEEVFRPGDTFRGWMRWYRDYLNAEIRDGDEKVGLGSAAWRHGPPRNEALANPPTEPPRAPARTPYPAWVYALMRGNLSRAKLGPSLLRDELAPGELGEGPWRLEMWSKDAGTAARILEGRTLYLENPSPNDASLVREIPIQPSRNYLFSAEVATRDIEIKEAGGRFGLNLWAGDSVSTKDLTGDHGWTQVSIPFTTKPKAETVTLRISIGGRGSVAIGKAMIRNVRLRLIGYPAAEPGRP